MLGVTHDLDVVDPRVADRGERGLALARGPLRAELRDVVLEPGARELVGVRVDHCVVEEILARLLRVAVPIGDAAVHVRVHRRVAALAYALDAPGHERGREVVEQHAVGDAAGQPQHLLVERGDEDLRPPVAEPHAEPEALHRVEVAFERHRLAAEALAHERHELADLRDRTVRVAGAVPLPGDRG